MPCRAASGQGQVKQEQASGRGRRVGREGGVVVVVGGGHARLCALQGRRFIQGHTPSQPSPGGVEGALLYG